MGTATVTAMVMVRCAFFGRNLHSRMPLDPTHVRLKRYHACDEWYYSRVSTSSYCYHRKLHPNTEGKWGRTKLQVAIAFLTMNPVAPR
jgi:hypothetical protein